jgi:hypothetical protein
MGGHESYDRETVGTSVTVRGQIAPGKNLELGNFTTVSEAPVSSTIEKKIESYLSRLNYDYKSIYFLICFVQKRW